MSDLRHIFLPAPDRQLMENEVADLARQFSPVDGHGGFSPETQGDVFNLDYYPDCDLVRLTDPAWLPAGVCVYLLRYREVSHRLNGTSPPIHEVNAKAPLTLSDHNASKYLRFFCFFVRGEEGPFHVSAVARDPLIPPEVLQAGLSDHIEEPRAFGASDEGNRRFSATILYGNAAFIADFVVEPTGMVRMADDLPVLTDLPAKIEAPLVVTGTRAATRS